jgi:hypothetical protein
VTSHWPSLYLALSIDISEHRSNITHDRGSGHLGADSPHALALRAALLEDVRPKNRVTSGAVVEIGQQHVIAHRAETAGHVPELFANARRVHQQKHSRESAAPLGTADKDLHLTGDGRDVQRLFDHLERSSNSFRRALDSRVISSLNGRELSKACPSKMTPGRLS